MFVLLKTDLPTNIYEHLPVNSGMAQIYVLTKECYHYNNILIMPCCLSEAFQHCPSTGPLSEAIHHQLLNLPPHYDCILSVISLFYTFYNSSSSNVDFSPGCCTSNTLHVHSMHRALTVKRHKRIWLVSCRGSLIGMTDGSLFIFSYSLHKLICGC